MPDGCGGSPAYAPQNRFPVVGMRYGLPSPIQPLQSSIDPPSSQSLSSPTNATKHNDSVVQDVTNEVMGGLNSLMITVGM